jgi:hypothetical protein
VINIASGVHCLLFFKEINRRLHDISNQLTPLLLPTQAVNTRESTAPSARCPKNQLYLITKLRCRPTTTNYSKFYSEPATSGSTSAIKTAAGWDSYSPWLRRPQLSLRQYVRQRRWQSLVPKVDRHLPSLVVTGDDCVRKNVAIERRKASSSPTWFRRGKANVAPGLNTARKSSRNDSNSCRWKRRGLELILMGKNSF